MNIRELKQIAILVEDARPGLDLLEGQGYADWVFDTCEQRGRVIDPIQGWVDFEGSAAMWFNYDVVPGIEYELLEYRGNHWHYYAARTAEEVGEPVFSHMSMYVDDLDAYMTKNQAGLVQTFYTFRHTNEHLTKDGRWFKEAIYDTREQLGFDLKVMQKMYGGEPVG